MNDLSNCLLSNFCNLILVHLDNSNYVTWKFMLETMLRGCGLMKYVDGSFLCPSQYMITEEGGVSSEMSAEYLTWKQNGYAVMTLVAATLSSGVLSFVVGNNTSRELWCLLKERFASTSWFNKEKLKSNFYKLQKGSDSIDKYLDRVKISCDQLANVRIHMPDEDIIVSVLLGLPSDYTTMKTIIRAKHNPISIQELRSLLLIAEAELEDTDKSISAPTSLPLSSLNAMVAHNPSSTLPIIGGHVDVHSGFAASHSHPPGVPVYNPNVMLSYVVPHDAMSYSCSNYVVNPTTPVTQVGSISHATNMTQSLGSIHNDSSSSHSAYTANVRVNNGSCPIQNGYVMCSTPAPYRGNTQMHRPYSSQLRGAIQHSIFTQFSGGFTQPQNGGCPSLQNTQFTQQYGSFTQQKDGGNSSMQNANFNQHNETFMQQTVNGVRMQVPYGRSQVQGNIQISDNSNGGFSTQQNKDCTENTRYPHCLQQQPNSSSPNGDFFNNNQNCQLNEGCSKSAVCQICEKPGHSARRCYHRHSQPQNIAFSSYVEPQICRRSCYVAKMCRYKKQSNNDFSQPKSASITVQPSPCSSMPLFPPG